MRTLWFWRGFYAALFVCLLLFKVAATSDFALMVLVVLVGYLLTEIICHEVNNGTV